MQGICTEHCKYLVGVGTDGAAANVTTVTADHWKSLVTYIKERVEHHYWEEMSASFNSFIDWICPKHSKS